MFSQDCWSSRFTFNATVLAPRIHRSPRKMSYRCGPWAMQNDRERERPTTLSGWLIKCVHIACYCFHEKTSVILFTQTAWKWPSCKATENTFIIRKANLCQVFSCFIIAFSLGSSVSPLRGIKSLRFWWSEVLIEVSLWSMYQ